MTTWSQPWSELAAIRAPAFPCPVLYSPSQCRRCLARPVLPNCFISFQTSPAWKPAQPSNRVAQASLCRAAPCLVRASLDSSLFAVAVCSAGFHLPSPAACPFCPRFPPSPPCSLLSVLRPLPQSWGIFPAPDERQLDLLLPCHGGGWGRAFGGGRAGELPASAHVSIFHPCTNVLTFKA